ncbi:PLP-dependent aminotransferase family protein [Paracoccus aestuariivivens]|uniref:Aminotransferase class I/II-fold pyridoxal phosphate-dependent enzyme n=1 Tax=Paracoccus aestuariivivens TaxID=1820333 RepID=A0A6L6JCT5_9RHOB|nr:PLP-dependent aminotransferase family protein [Paracoccus aestuariivivens]MTH78477.1 aminotransferase class I/II-fold pyridoxal phosphate-dependent enzyme [Paracoccus aestuariivivens]
MKDWVPALSDNGKPRYLQIADAIADAIRTGDLAAGDRLPPQRRLADLLDIDFTTVSRAYTEARARKLVDSHVGRGTFIRTAHRAVEEADPRRQRDEDLSMNMPPEVTDPELLAHMREGLASVSANLVSLLRYQSTTGSDQDKIAASTWLSKRGMVPSLERIAVTPGAHATMMAILSTIARPGDAILCERITYPGLRAIAARLQLRLVGIAMDEAGVIPELLEVAIERERPKALYLNPTLHNPTTLTIPEWRRLEIAEIITRRRLPAIEDDAYGFIPASAPAPFAALAPGLSWHIGGLAKCIGAGLRLAYVVAPDARAAYALAEGLRAVAVMPSPICTALMTRWVEDGTADRIRHFLRAESAARQQIAASVLSGFEFRADPNAFNIWLKLPEGAGRAELMGRMAGRHIGLMPADAFTVGAEPEEHLRICLGGAINREELRAGLLFLANSLSGGGWMG